MKINKEFDLGRLKLVLDVNKELYASGFALNLDIVDKIDNEQLHEIIQNLEDGQYEAYFPISNTHLKKIEIVDSEEHLNNESETNKQDT